jgi:hypothetical protein
MEMVRNSEGKTKYERKRFCSINHHMGGKNGSNKRRNACVNVILRIICAIVAVEKQ